MRLTGIVLMVGVSLGARTLLAQPGYVLTPISRTHASDTEAMAQVMVRAKQMKLRDTMLFEKQSFRLLKDGVPRGVFITGRASPQEDRTSFVCFVTIVEPRRRPNLLMTIEGTVDKVPICAGPRAVGVVDSAPLPTEMRIAILYNTSSAAHNEDGNVINPDGGETFITLPVPMVFGWNAVAHQLFLDKKACDKAGTAETLPALQKALR